MLRFLKNIKNRIKQKLSHRVIRGKRSYMMVFESNIINVPEDNSDSEPAPAPAPAPVKTLFCVDINESEIKEDYDVQELLQSLRHQNIDVSMMRLEPRFEEQIQLHPDIIKTKLRLLYVMIANDKYSNIFNEIKRYDTNKTKRHLGVFRYNNYIIRIDDSPYSFINENKAIKQLSNSNSSKTYHNQIILPFLVYSNIKRSASDNKCCECERNDICKCIYNDNADKHPDLSKLSHYSRLLYHSLRQDTISFSIQHYVKDTYQLYDWVKYNIGSYVYNQFTNIQYTFYIHLFHQCALLIRELHLAGIVHGDVKPDNILIREHDDFNYYHIENCKKFTVYLIDFGLSGTPGKGVGTGGTVPYCHPEFKNIRDITANSKYNWNIVQFKHDVWSLGFAFITLYIYHDFYSYYYKYPSYFFEKNGYVSTLILDIISDRLLNQMFTKILTDNGITINEVCELLQEMTTTS